jgi:hypothetical protein
VRPRDPRRVLERHRRARARVHILPVPHAPPNPDAGIGSKQVAEVTLPRADFESLWSPENLERLARTYWRFLTRISLGLLRVLYTPTSREVVFVTRPLVLLRFHAPQYRLEADCGTVTWPIERGLLVARSGRGRGYLRLSVRRPPADDGADEVTATVTSEVVNFYPTIAARVGRWIYDQTQLRLHVIVTHAFLRSLANLELEPSVVGALSRAARPRSPAASRGRGEP